MATVELRNVGKRFGAIQVLRDINLQVRDGEFLVLVGPSGCGKSTLLRAIAGLDDVDEGDVMIGDDRVNDLPPAKRGIAMVFQSYALYPHMNLYDNMAFGLRRQTKSAEEIDAAVRDAAKLLDIEHLLDRRPKALSGGQRQRVAIGRAIVRNPSVFLFDEPLSNLDAALRVRMRYEFAQAARAAAHDDHLRDPRPGRSDDAGGPNRDPRPRRDPAARNGRGSLRAARDQVRRRLHRLAAG